MGKTVNNNDIGAIYFTGFRDLHLSVCIQHFGPDIKMLRDKFRMPLIFKVGLAYDLIHFNNQRLTLATDLVHPTDNTERMNFGMELTKDRLPKKNISLNTLSTPRTLRQKD